MNRSTLRWMRVVIASAVLVALSLSLASRGAGAAGNPNPGVLPPQAHPQGLSYGEWSARWWEWAFAVPTAQNLQNPDPNAHPDCTAGQTGSVWFISGEIANPATGTFRAQRSCAIPTGTMLFYPLVNCEWDNVGFGTPPNTFTVDQMRAFCDPTGSVNPIDTTTLFATADGVALTNLGTYRAISPVFSYTVPPYPNNILGLFGAVIPGSSWPTTTVSPAVADGYYLMLAPLPPGQHTLTFGGGNPSVFREEMTYTITVQ